MNEIKRCEGTEIAPEGQMFVCGACGKRSRTQYGFISDGTSRGSDYMPDGSRVSDSGYDESCMLNAVLVYEQRDIAAGEYRAVNPVEPPKILMLGETEPRTIPHERCEEES